MNRAGQERTEQNKRFKKKYDYTQPLALNYPNIYDVGKPAAFTIPR